MRFVLIVFHLYFLIVSAAFSSGASRLQAIDYAVYIGGLNAVNINLDISLAKDNYDIKLSLNTEGLADKLFKWSMTAFSRGSFKQGIVEPRKAGRTSIWRGKRRSVKLTYTKNRVPSVFFDPEPKPKNLNPTPPPSKELVGARDLAGAILSYLTFASNRKSCVRSEPIYDGKRYYKLLFKNQVKETLSRNQYSPFSGPTLRCQFKLKKISGFRKRKQGDTWLKNESAQIWIARVFSTSVMVPVRIEMDTTLGGLFVYLVSSEQSQKGKPNKLNRKIIKNRPQG
ncbi:MAG: hypothetical protein CMM75_06400 [Rhodospirillaceae bacterium]|nr:hypothetical protein [Rhodospirillaceae bacterium]